MVLVPPTFLLFIQVYANGDGDDDDDDVDDAKDSKTEQSIAKPEFSLIN